ncbi:tetratricopeptide repeat protein, partial [Chloroflexi bacterium TSY]|nr:tetratricopeptide repeat protein [Chloroflexi bacterium TSY]
EIHELLRQFCQEKLAEEAGEETTTRDHHCHFFGQFLQTCEADLYGKRERERNQDKEALEAIEIDIDNARAGWDWAVAQGKIDSLADYLDSLSIFYDSRGWQQEAIKKFGSVAGVVRKQSPSPEQQVLLGRILRHLAGRFRLQDSYAQAYAYIEESLAIFRLVGEEAIEPMARAYDSLGGIALMNNNAAEEAEFYFRKAVDLHEQIRNQSGAMYSYYRQGWAALRQGDLERAAQYLNKGLAFFKPRGPARFVLWILKNLGDVAICSGNHAEAGQYFREGMAISKQLGDRVGVASSHKALGVVLLNLGHYEAAKESFQESSAGYQFVGNLRGAGWIFSMIAYTNILQNNIAEAKAYLQKSRDTAIKSGEPTAPWWCYAVQAELALVDAKYDQTEKEFQRAQNRYEYIGDIGFSWGVAWCRNGLGRAVLAQGKTDRAETHFRQALQSAMEVPSIPEALDVLVGLAETWVQQNEGERALALLTLVLHQSASRKHTAERAAQLQEKLVTDLPPDRVTAAQAQTNAMTIEATINEIVSLVE